MSFFEFLAIRNQFPLCVLTWISISSALVQAYTVGNWFSQSVHCWIYFSTVLTHSLMSYGDVESGPGISLCFYIMYWQVHMKLYEPAYAVSDLKFWTWEVNLFHACEYGFAFLLLCFMCKPWEINSLKGWSTECSVCIENIWLSETTSLC